jgi:uncharacterized membrane protein YbhN (UPF0104 family)
MKANRRGRANVRALLRVWVRPIGGVAILAVLLWRLGGGAFLDGLRLINGWAVVVALGVGALTTVSSAWRWRLVADGLGVRLPLRTAVAHCYRAVFLNCRAGWSGTCTARSGTAGTWATSGGVSARWCGSGSVGRS